MSSLPFLCRLGTLYRTCAWIHMHTHIHQAPIHKSDANQVLPDIWEPMSSITLSKSSWHGIKTKKRAVASFLSTCSHATYLKTPRFYVRLFKASETIEYYLRHKPALHFRTLFFAANIPLTLQCTHFQSIVMHTTKCFPKVNVCLTCSPSPVKLPCPSCYQPVVFVSSSPSS